MLLLCLHSYHADSAHWHPSHAWLQTEPGGQSSLLYTPILVIIAMVCLILRWFNYIYYEESRILFFEAYCFLLMALQSFRRFENLVTIRTNKWSTFKFHLWFLRCFFLNTFAFLLHLFQPSIHKLHS